MWCGHHVAEAVLGLVHALHLSAEFFHLAGTPLVLVAQVQGAHLDSRDGHLVRLRLQELLLPRALERECELRLARSERALPRARRVHLAARVVAGRLECAHVVERAVAFELRVLRYLAQRKQLRLGLCVLLLQRSDARLCQPARLLRAAHLALQHGALGAALVAHALELRAHLRVLALDLPPPRLAVFARGNQPLIRLGGRARKL
mmetsp:Transcript_21607/g.54821  ORF Transcript_21607/g.54821 Transcript_21607/m.54821 type:complete len:205 (-) Transcript_21607:129-743(-)